MSEPMERPAPVAPSATSPARAYGTAVLQSGFAFARAGVTSVGAFFDAGLRTIAAFGSAHRATQGPPTDVPPDEAAQSQVT